MAARKTPSHKRKKRHPKDESTSKEETTTPSVQGAARLHACLPVYPVFVRRYPLWWWLWREYGTAPVVVFSGLVPAPMRRAGRSFLGSRVWW